MPRNDPPDQAPDPNQRIEAFYKENIRKTFTDHGILGWESHQNHMERFRVLAEHIPFTGRRVLDVGCGLGNLLDFLCENWQEPSSYMGVDLLECMVSMARERNPDGVFQCTDIFRDMTFAEAHRGEFDIIVASGIFNLDLGNNETFLAKALATFRALNPAFIGFNFLDAAIVEEDRRFWLVRPEMVEAIVRLSIPDLQKIEIIRGRPIGDGAVIIWR